MLYQTYEDAYEMLESQVERITGERMYSEYSSFRIQYLRWKTKKTLTEVSAVLMFVEGNVVIFKIGSIHPLSLYLK